MFAITYLIFLLLRFFKSLELFCFLDAELGCAYHLVKGNVLKETDWFYPDYTAYETETVMEIKENVGGNAYWALNIGIHIMPLVNNNRFGVDLFLAYSSVDYSKTGHVVFKKLELEKQKTLRVICGGVTVRYALYK